MGACPAHAHLLYSFRPPNALELKETGGESIVSIDAEGTTVKMKGQESMKGPDSQGFTFDRAFQMDTKQEEVFEYGVRGIVDGELCFASRWHGKRAMNDRRARASCTSTKEDTFHHQPPSDLIVVRMAL